MVETSGKPRSLTQALLQYRGMLFGFIYALVRDVLVAEEIFQEVAVIAIEKDARGDELIREPAQWLKEVVRRLVRAGYRSKRGRTVSVDPGYLDQVSAALAADEGAERQQERLAALGKCLEEVGPLQRDLLRRRYVAGTSYDELGKELQRTAGALRVLVHRAQRQLADCVESRIHGD